jgi:hypothetical protein
VIAVHAQAAHKVFCDPHEQRRIHAPISAAPVKLVL